MSLLQAYMLLQKAISFRMSNFFDKFYVNISVMASVNFPDLSLFTCRLP